MATTALYRKSSNEVIKIASSGQTFADRDTTYWEVLTDPSFPDGQDTHDGGVGVPGDLRVLGYSKIQVGGTTVRNATQLEIDTFEPAEIDDENKQDMEGGIVLFEDHHRFRKLFKAMLKEFVLEFDKTRNPKAQMSIITGNTSQEMTSKVWEKITLFNNVDGRDSESFDTLSVDLTNSKIVSTVRGRHFCSFNISFTGDADTDFLFEVAVNGDRTGDIRARRKIGAVAEIGSCGGSGFLSFPVDPPGENEVTIQCRNMEDFDRDIMIAECQLVVFRLENHVGRGVVDLQTAINGQFSKDD